MAKSVILDVLNNTIGKYVLNLDTSSLNVAVWKGKIELRSLDLDSEAINRELASRNNGDKFIPFRVVGGHIRTLQIDVPWARITSRPVVFRAKDCHILLEPFDQSINSTSSITSTCTDSSTNCINHKKRIVALREQELKEAEDSRQRINAVKKLAHMKEDEIEFWDHELSGITADSSNTHNSMNGAKKGQKKKKKSSSFVGNLVRRIIENLQVEIDHVHLAIKGSDTIIGIVLNSFNIVTTDEIGNKTYVDRVSSTSNQNSKRDKDLTASTSFLHKSLKIDGFGIYCNEGKSTVDLPPITSVFDELISLTKEYILSPISFQTEFRRSGTIDCKEVPQFSLSSHLSTVSIDMKRSQLDMINSILKQSIEGKRSQISHPLFPEYRPLHPIGRTTAKMWWKYAVRCIGRLSRRRSWIEFFIAYKKRKAYIELYSRYIYHSIHSWITPLQQGEKERLIELEMDQSISVFGIMIWRNLADLRSDMMAEKLKLRSLNKNSGNNRRAGHTKHRWRSISPIRSFRSHRSAKGHVYELESTNRSDEAERNAFHYENELLITMTSTEYLNLLTSNFYKESAVSSNATSFEISFTLESFEAGFVTLELKRLPLFSMEVVDIKVSRFFSITANENAHTAEVSEKIDVDADFTTLSVNWNPSAVKEFLFFKNELASLCNQITNVNNVLQSELDKIPRTTKPLDRKGSTSEFSPVKKDNSLRFMLSQKNIGMGHPIVVLIRAKMKSLEINLNSAKDDLPLFLLTMAGSEFNSKIFTGNSERSGMLLSVVIDDFRMESAYGGHTRMEYRTILGLAPNQSASLLTVQYRKGSIALEENKIENVNDNEFESLAEIVLSPMRFVYIHAQVKTLVEYITQGVLGALAARMASSVAAAAIAISQTNTGEKIYVIKATGFEFIVPTSIHSVNNLSLHSGDLSIRYKSLLNPGEGEANLLLENVTIVCDKNKPLIDIPIKMVIDVILMPTNAPTAEERSIRFKVLIECVSVLLSKSHYAQIMEALDSNIGEKEAFLRDSLSSEKIENNGSDQSRKEASERLNLTARLTHGGVIFTEIIRRTYIEFRIQTFSLELKLEGSRGSLLCLTALETNILISLIPDEDERRIDVALRNLECEDRREKSSCSHFRTLLSQIDHPKMNDDTNNPTKNDVFSLSYVNSRKDMSKQTIVEFGSSHFYVNTDVIKQLFDFFRLSKATIMNKLALQMYSIYRSEDYLVQIADVIVSDEAGAIETSLLGEDIVTKGRKSFLLKSSDSMVTFINTNTSEKNYTNIYRSKLQETITLRGEVEVNFCFVVDIASGISTEKQFEINYDKFEIYTDKWNTLSNPTQLLEPTQISIFFTSELKGDKYSNDLKVVSLSHMQWILSIQNLALIRVIILNMKNSFRENGHEKKNQSKTNKISFLQNSGHEMIKKRKESNENCSIMPLSSMDENELKSATQALFQRIINMNITLTKAETVIINDLEGMDEALFKVTVTDVLLNGQVSLVQNIDNENGRKKINLLFKVSSNTLFLADYFNSKTNKWEYFLTESWEIMLKAERRIKTASKGHFTTSFDVESLPCKISFSEQFLISVGAAISMWKTFVSARCQHGIGANKDKLANYKGRIIELNPGCAENKDNLPHSLNCCVVIMPYTIRNDSGIQIEILIKNGRSVTAWDRLVCDTGDQKYFSFSPPPRKGSGTLRAYGQDSNFSKSLYLMIMDHDIYLPHVDYEVNHSRRVCKIGPNNLIIVDITKSGKTTLIYVSSNIYISNETNIDFEIFRGFKDESCLIGSENSVKDTRSFLNAPKTALYARTAGSDIEKSRHHRYFGIPLRLSTTIDHESICMDTQDTSTILYICPKHVGAELYGIIELPSLDSLTQIAASSTKANIFEVTCQPLTKDEKVSSKDSEIITIQVLFDVKLISQSHPYVELTLQPRLSIRNILHVNLLLKTKTRNVTYRSSKYVEKSDVKNVITYEIKPFEEIQVFQSGNVFTFSFTVKNDHQALELDEAGLTWVEIPIGVNKRLKTPIPYLLHSERFSGICGFAQSEFVIIESNDLWDFPTKRNPLLEVEESGMDRKERDVPVHPPKPRRNERTILISAKCVSFDHTEKFCLEQFFSIQTASLNKTFLTLQSSSSIGCNISILQSADFKYRLVKKSNEEIVSSIPFQIADIVVSDGGMESAPIEWADNEGPDCYLYRNLSIYNQIQVHIIPKFAIVNDGNEAVAIHHQGNETIILTSKMNFPIITTDSQRIHTFNIQSVGSTATALNIYIKEMGTKLYELRSIGTGEIIGTLTVSILAGNRKSRYIIKLGSVRYHPSHQHSNMFHKNKILADDFLRFRIKWSALEITVNDTAKEVNDQQLLDKDVSKHDVRKGSTANCFLGSRVARIEFNCFSVDFQKIFKNDVISNLGSTSVLSASDRSQLSIVVHSVKLVDCGCERKYSDILKCCSETIPFIDMCIRTRQCDNSDIIKVDLIDLNIASSEGKSTLITINGTEEFLWNLLDLANRIADAIVEISGKRAHFDWYDKTDQFSIDNNGFWTTEKCCSVNQNLRSIPKEKIYEVRVVRVSSISIVFSFKRQPQISRYEEVKNFKTAKFMSFITTRLKFTIHKADLCFGGYIIDNFKGSINRLLVMLKSEYTSRLRFMLPEILKATSVDDWKSLTGRDDGDEEYVGGDLVRLTGNLAGRTAGYVLKKVGQGIGDSVTFAATGIGNEIEKQTEAVGAGFVGARMNSLISGIGEGVGNTVKGVGYGSGKIIRGSVQGVCHIVGGVEGGILVTSKGVGDGISNGDGRAIFSAFENGISTLGAGIERGAGTAISGTADGVLSVGNGVLKGAQSICRGVGEVFTCQSVNNSLQMKKETTFTEGKDFQ